LEHINIDFCMPSLLGKQHLDTVTEYEKPGRVAANATICAEDILQKRKEIIVWSASNLSEKLGSIEVQSSF
jgi:hypothetical protein